MSISIKNFIHYNNWFFSGSRPTVEQLHELKYIGVTAILNIMHLNAKNPLENENILVESLNMEYQHLPLDITNVNPQLYDDFKRAINKFGNKKIFVHCGGNIYSSNLLHMFLVLEKGMDESESLQLLLKIHTPSDKWFSFFKSYGLTYSNSSQLLAL